MKNKQTLLMILILLIIALASIAWLSSFTRLYADDFCVGSDAQQLNPLSFFQKWYSTWTGRFSYIILAGMLSLGGDRLAALLPALSLVIWLLALSWAFLPILRRFGVGESFLPSITLGAFVLLILFNSTPNLFQSFFWRDGLINYTFPLIGLTIIVGYLLRSLLDAKSSTGLLIGVFLISFISGGFSEVFAVMQVTIYGILTLIVLITRKPITRKLILPDLFSSLAGGVLALFVVLLAPGNVVRQSQLVAHPDFLRLLTFSFRNALYIAAKFFIQTPGWAILAMIASIWAGLKIFQRDSVDQLHYQPGSPVIEHSHLVKSLILVLLTTFIIIVAACVPVVYMLNAYPDDRTILLPLFVLIIAVMLSMILLTKILAQQRFMRNILMKSTTNRWLTIAILSAVLIAAGVQVSNAVRDLPDYQNYTVAWEARDQELRRQAGKSAQEVTVPGLASRFGLSDLRVEDDFWVNRCMADYYQIPVIFGR